MTEVNSGTLEMFSVLTVKSLVTYYDVYLPG